MLTHIFYITLLCSITLADDELSPRIYQGRDVTIDKYPWMAKVISYRKNILTSTWDQTCTGTYIHEWWILTAATCVVKDRMSSPPEIYYSVEITMGMEETQGVYPQKRKGNKFVIDPYYLKQPRGSPRVYAHNLVLIKLNSRFKLNDRVQPHTQWYRGVSKLGCRACIAGFGFGKGTTFAAMLQVSDIYKPKQDIEQIKNDVKDIYVTRKHYICYGDLGGPLYLDRMQIGVATRFIHRTQMAQNCGTGRFVNIGNKAKRRWILKMIERM